MRHRGIIGLTGGLLAVLAVAAPTSAAEGISTTRNAETGRIGFIGTAAGATVARPAGVGSASGWRDAARAYADRFGARFGASGPGNELRVESVERGPGGARTVRLGQRIDGLPVVGGELVVNLDERRRATLDQRRGGAGAPAETEPTVSEAEAAKTAIASAARAHDVDPAELSASDGELSIFDSRILGGPGLERPVLVWRIEVGDRAEVATIREFVARRRAARQRRAQLQRDRRGQGPRRLRRGQRRRRRTPAPRRIRAYRGQTDRTRSPTSTTPTTTPATPTTSSPTASAATASTAPGCS